MKIGFPGLVMEVPFPSSGMGFGHNSDTESTTLLNGSRHIYSAPITHQTFSMSWKAGTQSLQPIIDIYNKRYGNRDIYIQNPNTKDSNLLPPRWAYAYQIAHLAAGQGQPYVDYSPLIPEAVFNDKGWGIYPPTIKLMATKGRNHYLKAWGTITGTTSGVRYRKHTPGTGWSAWVTHVPTTSSTDAPALVLSASDSQTVDFVELGPYVSAGGSLRLQHMDFSLDDYRSFADPKRPGEGIGALRMTDNADGELVSARIRRIGLAVTLTEVEYQRV